MNTLLHAVALSLIEGVGSRNESRLLDHFGSATAVLEASPEALAAAGASPKLAASIALSDTLGRAGEILDRCAAGGVRVLMRGDAAYPNELLECADAPRLLYVRGGVDFNAGHWLSVVGTRSATLQGLQACEGLVRDLAVAFPDAVVVSGLAFGVDKAAHAAALKYRLRTVAVMAGWVDDIVPRSHYYLARQLLDAGGAIVSDRPPETVIDRGNFIARNRIIAGLSPATVVVESAARGGSLITADLADSYHKEVFAIAGRLEDAASEGTNALIRTNKAAMYQSVENIAQALGWKRTDRPPVPPERIAERLREALDKLPDTATFDLEEASERFDLELPQTASLLGQLCSLGLVERNNYKQYYKTSKR